jgi:hypothetical protein
VTDYQTAAPGQPSSEESADCKAWLDRIKEARQFDEPARKGYAVDRRYARGDSGQFEVDVPIASTYIDILASFLYARDPDVDCLPAESAGPGRLEDARQFGKTLELVIRRLWKKGKIKSVMEPAVRSAITTGVGWFKAAWMERQNRDPILLKRIDDLQDNIARLNALTVEVQEGEGQNIEAKRAELEQSIQGLQAQVEVIVARGLGIDFIPAEDVQVSPNVPSLHHYLDAPWIAHRVFMPLSDAKAEFPEIAGKLKNATIYYQCKPGDPTERRDTGILADVNAEEADSHKPGAGVQTAGEGSVCVWEVQCRDSNMILTLVEGLDCYARPPMPPNPGTSRFYNLFLWAPGIVDGERHPQSLVNRSARLFDEYNRVRSAFTEHRRRAKPKLAFDAGNLSADEAKKLEAGGIGEMIPLKPLRPGEPIGNLLQPVQYNGIDMGLYDTGVIRAELEMLWGIQEALSSSVQTAKTATEAEMMQQGTMARISYRRDALEEVLTELGQHTAEIALQRLEHADVVSIAGPEAYWPEGLTVEELDILVSVEIRAGTTGKPDTTRQREAWATIMPLLQQSIMQVGQLRGSSPLDIAECIEELVAETLARTGERIDADRFLPDIPQMMPGMQPGMLPAPGAPAPNPAGVSNDPGIPAPDLRAAGPGAAAPAAGVPLA